MSAQNYLVTARKYRPQTFDELVAQEHVGNTLKNAIRLGRLAHAYLFSGPRGVGKTTAARILAKAINCTAPADERVDGAEPCRECDSCRSFEEGRSLSIFEIDAASNNKVEDVRELRETVRVPPQGSLKKVYIIDEVHMLSTQAFNALLKTLEEPPSHALFIFATTEPHKVLPTILSRCQRFDFRRIPTGEIVGRLDMICREEDVAADEASLMLIARKGDGALRDALSVFDQAIALCGTNLRSNDLALALGVVDVDLFFEVTTAVLARDSASMLRLVDRIVHAGHDLQEFLGGLAEHIRNLLVGRATGEASLIEATEALRHRYIEESAHFTEPDLLRLLMVVSETQGAIRTSSQPRLKIELALLKMAALTSTTDLRAILSQLDRVADAPATTVETRPERPPDRKPPTGRPPDDDEGGDPSPKRPVAPPPGSAGQSKPAPAHGKPAETSDVRTKVFNKPALAVRRKNDGPENSLAGDGAAHADAPAMPAIAPDELVRWWTELLEAVGEEKPRVQALLRQASPGSFADGLLTVHVPNELCQSALDGSASDILGRLSAISTEPVSDLRFVVDPSLYPATGEETGPSIDPYEYLQSKRHDNPVLKVIFEEFGGEIT